MRIPRFLMVLFAALLLHTGSHADDGKLKHDFHVSIADIRYNPDTGSLEAAFKIFTDDLEEALEGLGAPRLRLNTPREHKKTDSLLARYLENRVQISVNGESIAGKFLGKEYETDATWCYVEFIQVPHPEQLEVTNRLLFEYFDDQSNLVHIEIDGERKSLLLHIGMDSDSVEF